MVHGIRKAKTYSRFTEDKDTGYQHGNHQFTKARREKKKEWKHKQNAIEKLH